MPSILGTGFRGSGSRLARQGNRVVEFVRSSAGSVWLKYTWLLALAVVFSLRIPETLRNPQFWAEDGGFFKQAWLRPASLFVPFQGYHHLVPRLVAFAASFLDPAYAPAIYCYTAITLTLATMLLVMSDRLELPFRPLMALAVVAVAHDGEVFANMANVQWILAIGLLVVVLLKPGRTRWSLLADCCYLVLAALTGPFIVVVVPLFVVRCWRARRSREESARLMALTLLAVAAALLQIVTYLSTYREAWFKHKPLPVLAGEIWAHFSTVYGIFMMKLFGFSMHELLSLFSGSGVEKLGVEPIVRFSMICSYVFLAVFALGLWQGRTLWFQRISMLYLALAIMLMTIVRFPWLSTAPLSKYFFSGNDRYFFVPRVMVLWILISMLRKNVSGVIAALFLIVMFGTSAMNFRGHPWIDYQWKAWAKAIAQRQPVKIPINPPGFVIDMTTPE